MTFCFFCFLREVVNEDIGVHKHRATSLDVREVGE